MKFRILLLLLMLAFFTNPHDDGFPVAYQRKRFGLIGAAADHLAQQLGVVDKHEYQNYFIGSHIKYRDSSYIGAFGTYVELPNFAHATTVFVNAPILGLLQIPVLEEFMYSPDALALFMVLCWILWQIFPSLMVDHFTLSTRNLSGWRFWTIVSSIFSHVHLAHLIINISNMLMLVGEFNQQTFWEVFLAAGVLSGLASTILRGYFLQLPANESMGASGAVYGLLAKCMADNPNWQYVFIFTFFLFQFSRIELRFNLK